MKLQTKALRFVDVQCDKEYDKYHRHCMYLGYVAGYKDALKEISKMKDISAINQFLQENLNAG